MGRNVYSRCLTLPNLPNLLQVRQGNWSAPPPPLPDISALYFDNTDAPLGDVNTLTARGSWAAVLSNVAFTGGLVGIMGADALQVRGNILRNIAARGPFNKLTLLCDIRRDGLVGSRGDVISINPNETAPTRFSLHYDATRFRATGPNAADIPLTPIGGYGDRQTIALELDILTGTMTAIEADGEAVSTTVTSSPLAINRIELGKGALGLFYQIAIIVE